MTGSRLHQQLVEEGYRVGVTTVRQYVREWRRQREVVYVPLMHRPGESAQVDFFELTVIVAGLVQKAWKFLLYLSFSGRTFAWPDERCDPLSFLDGHVDGFAYLGGVPVRMVYDNLTTAVKRRVGLERELQEHFRALVSHYLFEPSFARPGEEYDKGAAESRGKGVRLQHLECRCRRGRAWRRSRHSCSPVWMRGTSPPSGAMAFTRWRPPTVRCGLGENRRT